MKREAAAPREYASAKWIGDYLGISHRTVADLSRRGLFPRYRLTNKVVRYRVTEVLAAMERIGGGR